MHSILSVQQEGTDENKHSHEQRRVSPTRPSNERLGQDKIHHQAPTQRERSHHRNDEHQYESIAKNNNRSSRHHNNEHKSYQLSEAPQHKKGPSSNNREGKVVEITPTDLNLKGKSTQDTNHKPVQQITLLRKPVPRIESTIAPRPASPINKLDTKDLRIKSKTSTTVADTDFEKINEGTNLPTISDDILSQILDIQSHNELANDVTKSIPQGET